MTTITASIRQQSAASTRRRTRLAAVALAAASTVASWTIATAVFGVTLRAPAFEQGAANPEIGAPLVAITTLAAGLAAWAALALSERFSPGRGPRIWLAIGFIALLVSFGGPLSGTGVTTTNRVVLGAMHVVAAAVLLPLLYRSSARRS